MKAYVLALAVGLLVGVLYYLFNLKSPSPPFVVFVVLLGIVIGEKIIPLIKAML